MQTILRICADPRFFPSLMSALSLCAAVHYACCSSGEWRKAVYWLAAAVITAVVTW